MHVLITQVDLKPGALGKFLGALDEMNAAAKEQGDLKALEVVQDALFPDRLVIYEVHATRDSWEIHRASVYFLAFDAKTADWLQYSPLVLCEGLRIYPERVA